MSTTPSSLKQIEAAARQEHDDFKQNTHKETTCSSVGSILLKLEATLGKPDTSKEYFQGWVTELVTLGVIRADDEVSFFDKLWSFLKRNPVVQDDDKIKIYDLESGKTSVITKTLSEMLALTIMALDDERGFDSSFKKTEGLSQIVNNLRFAFDYPDYCNTGIRNSIVEVLHKQYRFLKPNGDRGPLAYILSDLGSDIEGVMRNFFADELSVLLHSHEAANRQRGYRLLTCWMRDNLNQTLNDDEDYQDYLAFRAKRPNIKSILTARIHQFFEIYGVDPQHPDVQQHINERLPYFTQLDYPDVSGFSKEMQDLYHFLRQPKDFTEATCSAVRACRELTSASPLIRAEWRQMAVLEQAKRYSAQLPLGAAEEQLQKTAYAIAERLVTLKSEMPATDRLALISQWEDELNDTHLKACRDNNQEVLANSFAHLLAKTDDDIEFLMVMEDCMRRPSMKITERELRSLLESIPRKEGSVKLRLSPQVVNAILWHALLTTPLHWSQDFQTIMTLLIEQFEGPQKHYNDQKWIAGSYPQDCIDLFKWLNDCALHQEIRYMPHFIFMPCSIKGLERNEKFREWVQLQFAHRRVHLGLPIRGWFLDLPLDPTWTNRTWGNILSQALPEQTREFATRYIQRNLKEPIGIGAMIRRIPYTHVRQSVVLKHWEDFDIVTKAVALNFLEPFNSLFLLELNQKIKTLDELRIFLEYPRFHPEDKLWFIEAHLPLLQRDADKTRVLMLGSPEEIIARYIRLRSRFPESIKLMLRAIRHGNIPDISGIRFFDVAVHIECLHQLEITQRLVTSSQSRTRSITDQLKSLRHHKMNFRFLKSFFVEDAMVHPVFTPLKELVKRVSGYFSEGVLENADELLDLYEQSFKIEWDPRESTILLRSKQLMQAFEAGQATLGEVLRDLPKLDQNPAMAHSAELCQKINRHLAGEGAWAEVVEFYHHHCRLSLEPVSLPGVVRELRKSKVADLTLYVTTQILMAAMSTPLDRWDVYFKALVFEIAKRKGFAKILSLANQKFKIDDQLYWMSYPDYNQLKCHQIVFPFVLGECPIHPLPAEILKGLEQGRILRSPPEITLPEARADHPSMIL